MSLELRCTGAERVQATPNGWDGFAGPVVREGIVA